ncbi:MAG: hypothetical protein LBR73_02635, partial [Oscillospiraceae bacterium]|nr:hypothetical protein [Oscillospiraceae bacterium]
VTDCNYWVGCTVLASFLLLQAAGLGGYFLLPIVTIGLAARFLALASCFTLPVWVDIFCYRL